MALLLAFVYSTIELALAEILALEHARPAFHNRFITFNNVRSLALFLVTAISTEKLFLHLPAVALGWHTLFASTTKAFVTRSWTCVLTTGHHLIAHFATAPTRVIIGI